MKVNTSQQLIIMLDNASSNKNVKIKVNTRPKIIKMAEMLPLIRMMRIYPSHKLIIMAGNASSNNK